MKRVGPNRVNLSHFSLNLDLDHDLNLSPHIFRSENLDQDHDQD